VRMTAAAIACQTSLAQTAAFSACQCPAYTTSSRLRAESTYVSVRPTGAELTATNRPAPRSSCGKRPHRLPLRPHRPRPRIVPGQQYTSRFCRSHSLLLVFDTG